MGWFFFGGTRTHRADMRPASWRLRGGGGASAKRGGGKELVEKSKKRVKRALGTFPRLGGSWGGGVGAAVTRVAGAKGGGGWLGGSAVVISTL